MCLDLVVTPFETDIETAAELSICSFNGRLIGICHSRQSLSSQEMTRAASDYATNSASAEDRDTEVCRTERQYIKSPAYLIAIPVLERRVSRLPAQSESQKDSSLDPFVL